MQIGLRCQSQKSGSLVPDPQRKDPTRSPTASMSTQSTDISRVVQLCRNLRTQCNNSPTTTSATSENASITTPAPPTTASTMTITITGDHTPPVPPLTTATSIITATTLATTATASVSSPIPTTGGITLGIPPTIILPINVPVTSNPDLIPSCPHCNHTPK
nr:unnamed protein product [Spirometra erinaceieuropaei]